MTDEEADRDQRLQQVLVAYLEAAERGRAPEAADFLARHPEFAVELTEFLANRAQFDGLAAPLRAVAEAARAEADARRTLADGNATTGVAPGTKVRYFGDYELLEEIARGGMGVVFRARQVSLNRTVALKMILKGELATEADVRRFHAEAEAAANLDHPNIVPIYEVGEHEGQHYFSMKLIEGGSLTSFSRDAKGSAAAHVVAQVARAVHHAHQRGILHRDLKPANVLLDAKGEPLVTDFGLAKPVEGDRGQTQSGAIVGTPAYMPPEQARGEKALTTAVDVYSLGAILYELMTGRPPFRGATPLETILQVLEREPERPRALNPSADRDLETICLKCLEKEPAKRYGSAEMLADDLERWLEGEPIWARPVTPAERLAKWARRQPVLAGALASVTAAVLGLLVLAGILWQNAELRARAVRSLEEARGQLAEVEGARESAQHDLESTQRAVRRTRYSADLPLALAAWQTARVDRMCGILDRHRPGEGQEDVRGFEWHYLWRLAHAGRLTVGTPTDHFRAARFSPDGKLLALASSDPPTIKFLNVATGKVDKSIELPFGPARQIAFTSDGKSLVVLQSKPLPKVPGAVGTLPVKDFSLSRWDVKSCKQLSAQVVPISAQGMVLSPDLKKVVGMEHDKNGADVMVWNIAEQQPKRLRFGRNLLWCPPGPVLAPDNRTLAVTGVADSGERTHVGGIGMLAYSVFLWDLVTGEEKAVFNGHTGIIWGLAFSPDGKTLASASQDRTIRLWDPATGKQRAILSGHTSWVSRLAFASDGKILASSSRDGTIRLWNVAEGEKVQNFKVHNVLDLDFSPDVKLLASAAGDVKLWDVVRGPAVALTHSFGVRPNTATFSPDLKDVVSPNEWLDVSTGKAKHAAPSDIWGASPTFSPDRRTLAILHYLPEQGYATEVFLLDGVTGKQRGRLTGLLDSEPRMVFSANGRSIAGRRFDKQVALWDVATGKERLLFKVEGDLVGSLAFGPDDRTLIAGTKGGLVQIYDTATGAELRRFPTALKNGIALLYLSPDGRRIACTGSPLQPQLVGLFDLASGTELLTLQAPSPVLGAAYTPDGTRLATWGGEPQKSGAITFWDAATGDELLTFDREVVVVHAAFSRDGLSFGSIDGDGSVTIWDGTPTQIAQPFLLRQKDR